jgi:hypothetical protein
MATDKKKARRVGTAASARRGEKTTPRKPPVPPDLPDEHQKHKKLFLEGLAKYGIVACACEEAFISRTTAYKWRSDDAAFAVAWEAALEAAIDRMEKAAITRAVDGVEETMFGADGPVGSKRRYSDTLLMFLLKRHRPAYRENTTTNVNHSGQITTVIRAEELSDDELAAIIAAGSPGVEA